MSKNLVSGRQAREKINRPPATDQRHGKEPIPESTGETQKGATIMTDTQYGKEIAEKMLELQQAFRANLNSENPYYADYIADSGNIDTAAASMSEDTDFIENYLHDQMLELAKAVLSADWYGMFVAGYVPAASSREDYRKQEAKQTGDYYTDINKTLRSFETFMAERKNGIL